MELMEKCNIYFEQFVSWNGNEVHTMERKVHRYKVRPRPISKYV